MRQHTLSTGSRQQEEPAPNAPREDASQETGIDEGLARRRGIDLDNPLLPLITASERLSTVRYVFLVQIEDGIATADERASLEYADAVLIGWPEADDASIVTLSEQALAAVREASAIMEQHIALFRQFEARSDIAAMTQQLRAITEQVAHIREAYQPSFMLPTYEEIHIVVQREWEEDMGKIETPQANPTAEQVRQETKDAQTQSQALAQE